MVTTGVASALGSRVRTLVYLDAQLPEDGTSLFDAVGAEVAFHTMSGASGDGLMVPAPAAEFLDLEPANRARVDAAMTPHPLATFIEAIRLTGRERDVVHRTYIVATGFRFPAHRDTAERLEGEHGWRIVPIDCGHDVMIDRPGELADILMAELER